MRKLLLTTMFSCVLLFAIKAQSNYNELTFKNKPVWIEMMHDSTVNYYQAIKAFNIFWEDRRRPGEKGENEKEEAETKGRKEKREQRRYEKKLARMTPVERNEFDNLNYEYKMFIYWMKEVKPLVQADGKISKRRG